MISICFLAGYLFNYELTFYSYFTFFVFSWTYSAKPWWCRSCIPGHGHKLTGIGGIYQECWFCTMCVWDS